MESQIVDAPICIGLIQYCCCKSGNESEDTVARMFPQKESDSKVLSSYPKCGCSAEQYTHTHIRIPICYITYFNIVINLLLLPNSLHINR